ncbi:MAG: DMT family transporter [Bacteroidota bacterium]
MKEARGYIMILGAALFWGLSATAAKSLLNRQIDTILLVQSRVTFTFLLMVAFIVVFKRELLIVRFHDLWKFALVGIIGVAGANVTYYFTIRESTVATGILIQYTAPLLVMGYAAVTKEETITSIKIIAAILSLAGCFLAVGAYDAQVLKISPFGLLTGLGSIICFAFLNIFTRHVLSSFNLWTVIVYSMGFASAFWMVVNPPWRIIAQSPSSDIWGALFLLAIVSILIPHSLYFSGLRYVVPSRAIITSTFEPIVAIISATWFLQEFLEPLQIAGAVIVLAAIILLQVRKETPYSPAMESNH